MLSRLRSYLEIASDVVVDVSGLVGDVMEEVLGVVLGLVEVDSCRVPEVCLLWGCDWGFSLLGGQLVLEGLVEVRDVTRELFPGTGDLGLDLSGGWDFEEPAFDVVEEVVGLVGDVVEEALGVVLGLVEVESCVVPEARLLWGCDWGFSLLGGQLVLEVFESLLAESLDLVPEADGFVLGILNEAGLLWNFFPTAVGLGEVLGVILGVVVVVVVDSCRVPAGSGLLSWGNLALDPVGDLLAVFLDGVHEFVHVGLGGGSEG